MKKFFATTIIAATLAACSSTEPEFTAEKDVNFKPDLTKHSMAYNIAMSAGAPDTLRDAEIAADAYQEISDGSHAASFMAGFLADGISGAFSFGLSSLAMNKSNGFDDVMIISWTEVDTLENYGDSDFEEMVYRKTYDNFFNALIGNGTIVEDKTKKTKYQRRKVSGDICKTFSELVTLKEEYYIDQSECFLSAEMEIFRPVPMGSWTPDFLTLDKTKPHVIVKMKYQNLGALISSDRLDNAVSFFPANWRFAAKRKSNNEIVPMKKGTGYPYIQHKDKTYLFVKPKRS